MPGRITLPEYLLRPNALNPYSTVDPFLDRLPRLGKLGLLDQAGDDYALAPLGRDLLTSPVTDGVDHYRSIALESGHQPCYLARSVLRETRSLACCNTLPIASMADTILASGSPRSLLAGRCGFVNRSVIGAICKGSCPEWLGRGQ